ncbi:YycH protein [Jeotgalicoccus saudimassiliensis]|uniref:YycH protein n=1 Tax=Jeotgalicoccus saudimassiliensis TaxID=1461582 RepID=A0A078M7D3_9STAP|nr:two-component system regulatory protein YycI [Jeotgalicoccus saudimassiliensis]CEA02199.1 YycH protein [Jeotgalicoccus saudimassiliensis]
MDWRLAKSLFIAAFLLMNAVLVYILYNESNDEVRELSDTTNALSETNIDTGALDGFENVKMKIIIGEPEELDHEDDMSEEEMVLTLPIEEPVTFAPEGLKTYKDNSIYRGGEYHYDEVMSQPDTITFNQYYDGYPIFSHEAARLYFSEESATVTQGYVENIEKSDYAVEQHVRHPKIIVEELYLQGNITDNAVIESAKLGYYIILEENDRVMMRPKWQFEITDEDIERILYVDALSQTEDIIERE